MDESRSKDEMSWIWGKLNFDGRVFRVQNSTRTGGASMDENGNGNGNGNGLLHLEARN